MTARSLTVIALGVLAACGDGPGAGDRRILRVAYEREIDLLNPFTSQNLADISYTMIEGLVTTDENNRYVPVLASAIPTMANGLLTVEPNGQVRATWPLRSGVLWHDGAPFSAADVCFTWRFVIDPKSETYNREQYLNIVGCETPNDTTVVFTWSGEYAYYDGLFEAILPRHILGSMSAEEIVRYEPYNRGSKTIGTGPFRFAEWKSGEYIRVVRNDRYWRGADLPAIDEIVWAFIPDANTRLNALKAGRYHFGRILPVQVKEIQSLPGVRTHLVNSNSVMHLDLNVKSDRGRRLFGDLRVRQAIAHAIDREAIATQLMEGTVTIANSPINVSSSYHDARAVHPAFDPAQAAALLDQAGWTAGPDGVRQRDGERLGFTMLNRAGATDRIAVAQVIQAQLKAVGIEVRFETLESAAWTLRWRTGQWESIVSAWFLPADPSLTGLYACDGANNMTGFCDPALDSILERSDRTLDPDRRKRDLDLAQEMLVATARTLPLYYNVVPEVVSRSIGNYRGSGTNFGSFWNVFEWPLAP
ncbi:MAG: peptide ABC transporter substrate-binding protein [Gemmatimonadetes bacterium]|nr:peptide ABC transporter substrate-binding protein [Gemmatimonadota bacterium]